MPDEKRMSEEDWERFKAEVQKSSPASNSPG